MAASDLVQDLRYAARRLRKTKLDSAVIVLSLALGIGANLAVLNIVRAVLFDPLDVPDPGRLVAVYNQNVRDPKQYSSNSWPDFERFRQNCTTLDGLASYARLPFLIHFGGEFKRVSGEIVSPDYFQPRREMTLQISAAGNPLILAAPLQEAVRQIAPGVPLLRIATMETHLQNAVARERMTVALAGTLSALAMVLLCVGLYGLISFHVVRRTREIGIRIALGARGAQVLLLIWRQGALLLLLGVFAGVPLSLAAARLTSSLLYGVNPADVASLLAGGSILFAAGVVATLIPAWRAARIDPAAALRGE